MSYIKEGDGILHQIFRFSEGFNIWDRIHQSNSWHFLGASQTFGFLEDFKVDFWRILFSAVSC